jgi:hypothetical protein
MNDDVEIGKFGFRFECQPGCTNCCRQPGEVWLTAEDRDRIAAHLGLSVRAFVERYCTREEDDELKLSVPAADSCHFLLEEGCSIHDVKPVQCRTYPFWPEHVRTRPSWKKLERVCPGVGVGELLPVEQVRAAAQECADAFTLNPPVAPEG